ncbi:hypothetical protein ACFQI7_15695 [Paenibacillus allorhizosphaerae]|uniref:HEPN domain-containing protein n=1 Tax=Paenibacillus allorhizosphaerae TaxID=2849866 RepID=A0ABN7TG80_9BACL|nr:hypothetical protein [Paenibacillus allorhizosphaerae]CAG7629014.1 hypothetical protein PAECIP111802_01515 [Paenibacillus allorhizosphaerae]
MLDMAERITILKECEQDCYSICYYLLQCEKMACEASQNALYRLFQTNRFFVQDSETVKEMLRKESIRCALQVRKLV